MSRATDRPADRDRGSVSLYVLWVGVVVVTFAVGLGAVAVARIASARAAGAADLAALAGAAAERRGDDGCGRAKVIAGHGGARLVRCDVAVGGIVTVVVVVPLRGALARFGTASARARAGPADMARAAG
ncbi:MAG TPA: Rv3654c family TadE-like protein [Mycobacteriales bacterium]|nr:Rv3654c family TadE-like protein [Mycobacteriales bacterium]